MKWVTCLLITLAGCHPASTPSTSGSSAGSGTSTSGASGGVSTVSTGSHSSTTTSSSTSAGATTGATGGSSGLGSVPGSSSSSASSSTSSASTSGLSHSSSSASSSGPAASSASSSSGTSSGSTGLGSGSSSSSGAAGCDTYYCQLPGSALAQCCGDTCTDIDSNPNACGNCGRVCPTGSACLNGACTLGCADDTDCPAGLHCTGLSCESAACPDAGDALCAVGSELGECCSGVCADVQSSSSNCGGCGIECNGGTVCDYFNCLEFGATCSEQTVTLGCAGAGGAPGTCCPDGCVDLSRSNTDCGGCGAECPTGASCFGGACRANADAGILLCDGDGGTGDGGCQVGLSCVEGPLGAVCLVTSCTSAANGASCSLGSGQLGVCSLGYCTSLLTNTFSCGNITDYCSPPAVCSNGLCLNPVSCAGSRPGTVCAQSEYVSGACCGASCVDFQSDPANCGGCAQACSTGVACELGHCVPDGGSPSASCELTGCPLGYACLDGACTISPCSVGVDSPCPVERGGAILVGSCCGYACYATSEDPLNCGQCANVCSVGTACVNGVCLGPDGGV